MPHRSRVLSSGEKVVTKVLPATWKWKDTIPELNEVNTSFELKKVFESNVNKIRRRSFEEYEAKKPEDDFAHCSSCNKYHSLRKLHQPGTQAALLVATKLQMHLIRLGHIVIYMLQIGIGPSASLMSALP